MSVDKLGAYDGVKGVFADLDDGGLTNDEALDQIRELVGAKAPIKRVLITMLVPVNVTVNIDEGSVESAEMEAGNVWGVMPNAKAQNADTQTDLRPDSEGWAVEKAEEIAAGNPDWTDDITTI